MERTRAIVVGLFCLSLVVLFGATAGCGGDKDEKLTQPQLVEIVKRSTVRLTGKLAGDVVSGSGVVIDAKKGQVLTNAHVVGGVSALRAKVQGSPEVAARLDAQDPCADLAIVTLSPAPDNLKALKLGDSEKIRSGQHITALGYPAGLSKSPSQKAVATEGTVSATGLSAEPAPDLPRYISLTQHQAPINPGSSGGPLVDDRAELIGINTLRSAPETQGQYFAISSNQIEKNLPTLSAGKNLNYVGWNIIPGSLLRAYGEAAKPSRGMYVLGVDTGSPADRAKFRHTDFIDALENDRVDTFQDVCDVVQSKGSGALMKVAGEELQRKKYVDYDAKVRVQSGSSEGRG